MIQSRIKNNYLNGVRNLVCTEIHFLKNYSHNQILTELENQIRGSIPLTIERRSSIMRFSGFFPL